MQNPDQTFDAATPLRATMYDYSNAIVDEVRHSIQDLNDMISLLSKTEPLSTDTDFLPLIYSSATVERYYECGTSAVEHLGQASTHARNWLEDTGNRLAENLVETNRVRDALRGTSSAIAKSLVDIGRVDEDVRILRSEVESHERDLVCARYALEAAEEKKKEAEVMSVVVDGTCLLSGMFLPLIPAIALTMSTIPFDRAVEEMWKTAATAKDSVDTATSLLESSREALRGKRSVKAHLLSEHARTCRREREIAAQVRVLEQKREYLTTSSRHSASSSSRINDCLYAVSSAYSGSQIIPLTSSIRTMVSCVKDIVLELGRDELCSGPLVELDESAIDVLVTRMIAITEIENRVYCREYAAHKPSGTCRERSPRTQSDAQLSIGCKWRLGNITGIYSLQGT
ncbi:hypothetical protein C8Q74DRAFT_518191 [Fomes fomentarius]|nr:hypothetical protein C8Q74DRAFT_518191 [Fomes fomentarius]